MTSGSDRPAFYATRGGALAGWWSILHPPYTAWHLSYVALGAALAPAFSGLRLAATLAAFFLAVGIAAHALDELNGRPLATTIPSWALAAAATLGLSGAVALGIVGCVVVSVWLVVFMVIGVFVALAYNLEWFGGLLHTDWTFAAAWGAFPVVTGAFAQTGRIGWPSLVGAFAAFQLSAAQRSLSAPARMLRRRVSQADLTLTAPDGAVRRLERGDVLAPLERALKALSWGVVALAVAAVLARAL
ncbi:MAG: hypothetical protein HYX33_01030 [Actinobacteria bacterium]|nr:hypothetical protein [Actinomycetota bacterium]